MSMKPSRWDRINALLDEVLALPGGQREAHLQARCGDDPELLQEVRSLLAANEDAGSFLETPAGDYAATLIEQESPGQGDPLIGKDVDGYRILGVLGRGGMGIVYKARNLTLDRVEALKVIAPFLVRDAQFLRRFQLEARALARIHHPNIVTVYTLRKSRLGHYITMEYVAGTTLADVLVERGEIPWQEALSFIRQLLDAFEYAHQRGIIHRDIKPRNIMITPEGAVRVMDFGLAKFYLRQDLTQTGGLSGTLCYMSPEQIKGSSNLDQRSDIFSLGITLYEVLCGRLPFDRNDSQFSIQRAIVEEAFPTPDRFNSAVPPRLSQILMKALEKEPEQRFQHVREMQDALDAFEEDALKDDTVRQHLAPAAEPPRRTPADAPSGRRWRRAVAGLVLAGGLAWSAYAVGPSLYAALVHRGTSPDLPELAAQAADGHETDASSLDAGAKDGSQIREDAPDEDTPATLPAVSTGQPARQEAAAADPPAGNDAGKQENTPTGPATNPVEQPTAAREDERPAEALTPEDERRTGEDAGAPVETAVEADPPPPPNPVETAVAEARTLRDGLKEAILNDAWADLPSPVAAFYQEKLKKLPRQFRIMSVGVEIDDSRVQTDGLRATLPITVRIDYQQKGRDGLKSFPIPSTWTWSEKEGRLVLVDVR